MGNRASAEHCCGSFNLRVDTGQAVQPPFKDLSDAVEAPEATKDAAQECAASLRGGRVAEATPSALAASAKTPTTPSACTGPEDGGNGDSASATPGSAGSGVSTGADTMSKEAKHMVKNFVRSMVKGRVMSLLSVSGEVTECNVTLDRGLSTLSLQKAGKKDSRKRGVPLETVEEVFVGKEDVDVELPVDDMCVTLFLTGGQALTFRFSNEEERDTFALCLSMFANGRKGEADASSNTGTLSEPRGGQKLDAGSNTGTASESRGGQKAVNKV